MVIGYVCFLNSFFFVWLSGKSKPVQRVRITLLHCFCSRFHPGLASRAVSSSLNLSNLWPCGQSFLWCQCPLAGRFVTCKVLATSPNMWSRWVATLKVKIRGFAWICRVKPGKETHKGICDFSREKSVCDWQDLFCDWVPAKWVPADCEGKPEHPAHKGIFDFNRNEEMVCKSQYMFCDWAPAKKSMSEAWDLTSVAA